FAANEGSAAQTVTITDGSLTGVARAINQAGIGVQASVMFDGTNYRLSLASSETGAARSMQIEASDADGNDTDAFGLSMLAFNGSATHMQQAEAASDTVGLMVDGVAASSSNNRLIGMINGLDITLQAPGSTSISVTPNDKTLIDGVADFVDKYNAFIDAVNLLTGYDAATKVAGQLNGDSLARSVADQVRRVMGSMMGSSSDALRHLSQIGITSDVKTGKLVLDSDRLQAQISVNREGVAKLFTGTADESGAMSGGYASNLDRIISGLLASNGPFSTATDGVNASIRDISKSLDDVQTRSLAYEERIRAQFNAMDTLVGQLRSTSNFLTQQLENLPTIGGNSSK
ncbi:MAG: flagellar filament capping protein FliD, partial [Chromatiales bacterium]|nr:flagellar filament capping protein FliD [Chromatiales bacterium]